MSRAIRPGDDFRTVRLVEALRGYGPPVNVENMVLQRIRRLPLPGPAMPRVSLRQFGWGSAAAVASITLGALGLLGTIGASRLVTASATSRGFLNAARPIGRAIFDRLVEFAGYASSIAALFDGALLTSAGMAVLACAAMLTLTILVVSREALGRKVTG